MASLAGAFAAIEARLSANWTTTGISYENRDEAAKQDAEGNPVPWVFVEFEMDEARIIGVGTPGDHVVKEWGAIRILVFTPAGVGAGLARTYAGQIGEIFRAAKFYDSEPNTYVRTWTPRIGRGTEGVSQNPDGTWWCVSVSVPFEFYHRA